MFLVRIAKQWRAALGLLVGMTLSAEAHGGPRVFPIAYLTDEALERIQLDDGTVDEWYGLIGEPSLTLLDFTDEWKVDQPDPSDFDFRIWLAWHDEPPRIYVALVASDDNYKNTHDYSSDDFIRRSIIVGNNDALTLGIDGDHSGGAGLPSSPSEYTREDMREHSGKTQNYEAISRTNGPNLKDIARGWPSWISGTFSWRGLPPYADAGGSAAGEAPVIWVIELYVTPFDHGGEPWDSPEGSVVSDLVAGQFIGFSIGVQDFDRGGEGNFDRTGWVLEPIDSQFGAFDDIQDYAADTFLDGLLLPEGGAEPGDSAAESVSWGRIKASLEME